jgi:hypothetical protein
MVWKEPGELGLDMETECCESGVPSTEPLFDVVRLVGGVTGRAASVLVRGE